MKFRTVGEIVAELQTLPQDLPVLVGCHYDNDDGLRSRVQVLPIIADHGELDYFHQLPPGSTRADYPTMFGAVAIA